MQQDTEYIALVVDEQSDGTFSRAIKTRRISELPPGDILIKVQYSSLNYKDVLSASGNKGVTRHYPHTPGIDAAGIVVQSTDACFNPGEEVVCIGYDLGMNTSGGFGQYIRVPADWVMKKPAGLSLKQCMEIGTAGFTALQCILALEQNGVNPETGPVLVTGATGGVGLISCMVLAQQGYEVHALTGKKEQYSLLSELGVCQVHDRSMGLEGSDKLLHRGKWAGCVDTVGGQVLANMIKSMNYDGVVTSCGNAMSGDLPLNVYPFILRGVHLIGIYSAECSMEKRKIVWGRLEKDLWPSKLQSICSNIALEELNDEIDSMLAGNHVGRKVVILEDKE